MIRKPAHQPSEPHDSGRTIRSKAPSFPIYNGDDRPSPTVLSQNERLAEFGRLMFRAIERRRARRNK